MNFLDLVKKRTSIRSYSSREIEPEKLNYIMEAVRLAPSAVNIQPLMFYIVSGRELLTQLHDCYPREWFKTAPTCIVACGDHKQSWHRQYDNKDHCDIDVAIAVDHLTLAAAEQELGTCWVCNFDAEKCAKILHLSEGVEPMVLVPIGYSNAETVADRHLVRKDKEDIIHFEN